MATALEVGVFNQTLQGVTTLAEKALNLFFLNLQFDDIVATTNALEIFMPALVAEYGEIGAAVAVDFYDELREGSPAKLKPFSAEMAELPNQKAIQASTRWAVGPLFQQEKDPDMTLRNLTQVTDRMVKQVARDTIFHSAQKDPSRASYARVPSRSNTCKFCLMLASRGAVYASEKAAGKGNHWHAYCGCSVIPMWDGDAYPRGYDPDALYEEYSNQT